MIGLQFLMCIYLPVCDLRFNGLIAVFAKEVALVRVGPALQKPPAPAALTRLRADTRVVALNLRRASTALYKNIEKIP